MKGIRFRVPFFSKIFFKVKPLQFYFCIMNSDTGKWVIVIGIFIILAGVIIYFFHDKLHWIGRLPGDIRVEKENFRFYFPITTMVIFSLLLTLIIQLIKRFL
jgi:hypothetical protein